MARFVIDIQTRGFNQAKRHLADVSNKTQRYKVSNDEAMTATGMLRKEVGLLRNNMLLLSFASGVVVTGLGRFIQTASDAKEQMDQFNIVFGDFAPEAEAFASKIQSSFGIAKSEMISLMNSLQDTFVPLGFSREQATELSISLSQLSLDVGAFKNVATSEVANAFTSAIIGNHEAVRKFGISLTEATLETEAMRLGLIEAGDEMNQEAKILSRISLISRGTADATDNLTKTQKEFASMLRGTQGRLQQTREEIGQVLIPFAKLGLHLVDFIATGNRATIMFSGLSVALIAYSFSAMKAAFATATLTATMMRNIYILAATGIALAINEIGKAIGAWGDTMSDTAIEVKKLDDLLKDFEQAQLDLSGGTNSAAEAAREQQEALEAQRQAIEGSEKALEVRLALMKETTEEGKARARVWAEEQRALTSLELRLLQEIDAINAENKVKKEAIKLEKERLDLFNKESSQTDAIAAAQQQIALIQAEMLGKSDVEIETLKLRDELYQDLAKAMNDQAGNYAFILDLVKEGNDISVLENAILENSTELTDDHIAVLIKLFNWKKAQLEANEGLTKSEKQLNEIRKDFSQQTIIALREVERVNMQLTGATEDELRVHDAKASILSELMSIAEDYGHNITQLNSNLADGETMEGKLIAILRSKNDETRNYVDTLLALSTLQETLKLQEEQRAALDTIFQDNLSHQIEAIEEQAERFRQLKIDEVAITEWAEEQKLQLAMNRLDQEYQGMEIFSGAYNTFIDSLTDVAMHGADRYDRVMEAMQSSVIKFFADLITQAIKHEMAMQLVTTAGQATSVATTAITGKLVAANWLPAATLAATATGGTAAAAGTAAIAAAMAANKGVAAQGFSAFGNLSLGRDLSFAKGGEFITSGPQRILVGDNPGGREHIRINPLSSSPGPDAPSSGNITVNISAPLVDETVVDSIIPAIERAKRLNLA